jgi:hypothetical protein
MSIKNHTPPHPYDTCHTEDTDGSFTRTLYADDTEVGVVEGLLDRARHILTVKTTITTLDPSADIESALYYEVAEWCWNLSDKNRILENHFRHGHPVPHAIVTESITSAATHRFDSHFLRGYSIYAREIHPGVVLPSNAVEIYGGDRSIFCEFIDECETFYDDDENNPGTQNITYRILKAENAHLFGEHKNRHDPTKSIEEHSSAWLQSLNNDPDEMTFAILVSHNKTSVGICDYDRTIDEETGLSYVDCTSRFLIGDQAETQCLIARANFRNELDGLDGFSYVEDQY